MLVGSGLVGAKGSEEGNKLTIINDDDINKM